MKNYSFWILFCVVLFCDVDPFFLFTNGAGQPPHFSSWWEQPRPNFCWPNFIHRFSLFILRSPRLGDSDLVFATKHFFLILVFGAKTHSAFVQLARLSKAPVVGARSLPEWPPLLGPGARAGSRGRLRFPTASTGFSLKRRHQLSSRSVPRLQCSASGFVRFTEDFSRSVDSAARIQVFSSV
jgi:hypothetical protein